MQYVFSQMLPRHIAELAKCNRRGRKLCERVPYRAYLEVASIYNRYTIRYTDQAFRPLILHSIYLLANPQASSPSKNLGHDQ